MPPRIQCLRVTPSPPLPLPSSVRCFATSPPNRHPRKLFPEAGQKRPSKFNPFTKNGAPKVTTIHDNNPYQWSSIKPPTSYSKSPLPNTAWEINKEQNLINQLRINPVDIDPKQSPDDEVENALTEWNRQHGAPPTKSPFPFLVRVDK